ncbi:MAG: hypothetical protein AB1649_03020 [Chloroflexota bacterium]
MTPWVYPPPKEMAKFLHGKLESAETLVTYHWRHKNQHSRMIEEWMQRNGHAFSVDHETTKRNPKIRMRA